MIKRNFFSLDHVAANIGSKFAIKNVRVHHQHQKPTQFNSTKGHSDPKNSVISRRMDNPNIWLLTQVHQIGESLLHL